MRPGRLTAVLVAFALTSAGPAAGQDGIAERFAALAMGYDAEDSGALPRAAAALRAEDPDFLETPLPECALRADLARSLSREDVLALFGRAARDPEERLARWLALTRNLLARPTLAAELLEVGAPRAFAGLPEWGDALEALLGVAAESLLDGDSALATALLSEPMFAESAASRLASLSTADGLRLLSSVLGGDSGVPAECRARLGWVLLDVDMSATSRPLGAPAIGACLSCAMTDEDPALRVLAARVLLSAKDPAAADAVLRAYEAADSDLIEADEIRRIGAWYGPPPADRPTPLRLRHLVTQGWIEAGLDPYGDPVDADLAVAEFRGLLARARDPRTRGLLLRLLDANRSRFYLTGWTSRRRPLPSAEGLLRDLEAGREGDAPELLALGRRIAARCRRELVAGAEADAAPEATPPPHPVPPYEEAEQAARRADALPALVAEWLRADPDHLLTAEFAEIYRSWPLTVRTAVLDAYPEATLRRLLDAPPTRSRLDGGDDLTGARNRSVFLGLLAEGRCRGALVLAGDRWRYWPAANRRQAGEALHASGLSPAEVGAALEDDALAEGYLWGALDDPRGPDGVLAARVVGGLTDRPAVRGALADRAVDSLPEGLGEATREGPRGAPLVLDAELRAALVERLRGPDPWVAWLAARLLSLSGTVEDWAALLAEGEWLDLASFSPLHPFASLVEAANGADRVDLLLRFLERDDAAPAARTAVADRLFEIGSLELPSPEAVRGLYSRLEAFAREKAPFLTRGLAERVLEDFLVGAPVEFEEQALAAFREAVGRIPAAGPRLRLRGRYLAD